MTEGIIVALIGCGQAVSLALIGIVASRVGKVNHELKPNSGKSMRDAVDRIEKWQRTADRKLDRDNIRLGALEHRVSEHIEQSATIVRLLTKKEKP